MVVDLKTGLSARIESVVELKDTASAVASGLAEVYATPCMIALMENAAYRAVQDELPEGCSTVGVEINVKHMAATPVGLKVWAKAVLTAVEGRKLTFALEAFDEMEKIGEASHTRFVIESEKFLSKAYSKRKAEL